MPFTARLAAQAALLGLAALSTACATKDGWMGAEKEKAYDADLAAKRLAEGLNNDDYFEIRKDNTIFVFADAKSYKIWLKTDEIPLVVTKFRVGPNGEKGKFALDKNETKAMEKIVGYKGGAQNLYEGNVQGIAKGFFGFVQVEDGTFYVFDNWNNLQSFRKGGSGNGYTASGPKGAKVVYVGASSEPKEAAAKFAAMHDGK